MNSSNEHQTIVASLIKGEQSGVSKRRVPDILAALRQELSDKKPPLENTGNANPATAFTCAVIAVPGCTAWS